MSTKTRIIVLMSALLMAIALQASAMKAMSCDSACSTMVTRHYGFLSGGVSWINPDDINGEIALLGVSSFGGIPPTFSIGGHKEMRRLVYEHSLTLRFWQDQLNANVRTSLMIGDISWLAGFNLMPAAVPATVFPYAGLGIGLNTMHIRSDSKTVVQAILSNEPDLMLWQTSILLNVGAGGDYFIQKNDQSAGLVLGIRAGYIFDPFFGNARWNSGWTTISDMPALKQNGPYVRLIVGGWGHRKDHSSM